MGSKRARRASYIVRPCLFPLLVLYITIKGAMTGRDKDDQTEEKPWACKTKIEDLIEKADGRTLGIYMEL